METRDSEIVMKRRMICTVYRSYITDIELLSIDQSFHYMLKLSSGEGNCSVCVTKRPAWITMSAVHYKYKE